jgi:hypothetical protein
LRRLVASVDNVAEGSSPASHLPFLRPEGEFRARGDIFENGEPFEVRLRRAIIELLNAQTFPSTSP